MGCIGNMGDSSEYTNTLKFSLDSPPSGITSSDYFEVNDLLNSPDTAPSYDSNHVFIPNQTSSCSESELSPEAPDFSDACLKYMSDILMGNLDDNPSTVQDYMALHATEKSLYEAIGESYSLPSDHLPPFMIPDDGFEFDGGNVYSSSETTTAESSQVIQSPSLPQETSSSPSVGSTTGADDVTVGRGTSAFSSAVSPEVVQGNLDWIQKALSSITHLGDPEGYRSTSSRGFEEKIGRKTHQRDERDDGEDGRDSKHLAAYVEEEVQMEQFDDILLGCKGESSGLDTKESSSSKDECTTTVQQPKEKVKKSKGKGLSRRKKQSNNEDMMDLNPLLTQCAQAVATFDIRGANELLKRIRQHSSSHGDGIQRVAHYFADGLEARLAGNASQLYSDFINWQISVPSFLHAYRSYVSSVPFKRTSFYLANKTINKISAGAKRVHVIDFGIFYGIQWPCLIQLLSKRLNGPPLLRLTAVDFPERGYQPAAKVEETVRRLKGYCKRFGVPFEHNAIAQRWDTLQPEDFNLREDEVLVVNCLYRARALLDDTVDIESPRDAFLKLVAKLNPDLFIHGIVNGTYNAPFFTTRFKEALFHFSSMFDMFEATMGREDEERKWIEKGLYGRDILNVVACEGTERVERPETYKQWQVRTQRAGLRQVPLDREIVGNAKAMVRSNYHKDFVVDEDNNWMLQGWKGRLLYALSCWKPA